MKKRIKKFFKNVVEILKKPEIAILPGQLAFFFVLAIVPTLTLFSYGAALLNLSTDSIYNFLSSAFSDDIASLLLSSSASMMTISGFNLLLVIIPAYYISSTGAVSIINTSNTIYGIKNRGIIRRRLKSFVMIFLLLFLFLFMLLVPIFGYQIVNVIRSVNMLPNFTRELITVIKTLKGPVTWLIVFIIIKVIYTIAPDKKIRSRSVNYGAFFTTSLWVLVTWIYSFYINNYANFKAFYGSLANIVILMLWFYILALIFTIGMALNYRQEELEKTQKLTFNFTKSVK